MACLEHECLTCGNVWMDNRPYGECSMCGSTSFTNWFDEEVTDGEQEARYDRGAQGP